MGNQKKESLNSVLYFLLPLSAAPIVLDYLLYNNIAWPSDGFWSWPVDVLLKFHATGFWKIRLVFVFIVTGGALLSPALRIKRGTTGWLFLWLYCISACLTVWGYQELVFYDVFVYPFAVLCFVFSANKLPSFLRMKIREDGAPLGLSRKKSDFMFEFPTTKGIMNIHLPQMNIWVEAGPGGGKSESIVGRVIQQSALKGYPGLVYDFEGDPRETGSPMLNRIAYASVLKANKRRGSAVGHRLSYAFINFTDVSKTVRVNPLAPRYVESKLDVQELVQNLMANLSVNKDKGGDFWEKYGTAYIFGIAWMLVKNHPGFASIPHMVTVALNDIDVVLGWASADEEVRMIMSPLISAWNKKAEGQLAGAETSAQLPISVLFDENIFWVLSKDSFDLDITKPTDPYMLGIGNSKKLQQALAPAISGIITVIMKQMNCPGKLPSVFCVDEFPTVQLKGVDAFIATARKHGVSTVLALQDFEQAVRDYGEKSATILRTSCGNLFFGLTGNSKTADFVSNLFGEIKKESVSLNVGTDSQSTGTSLQREKTVQARDVMIQQPGHMMGKIAGGEPPLFSAQFERFMPEAEDIPKLSPDFEWLLTDNSIAEDAKLEIIREEVKYNFKTILDDVASLLGSSANDAELELFTRQRKDIFE